MRAEAAGLSQSEDSIQVTLPLLTNQRPSGDLTQASVSQSELIKTLASQSELRDVMQRSSELLAFTTAVSFLH